MSMLSTELTNTLSAVARMLSDAKDAWWVLGSVAVAVKGYEAGHIADIDVLVSPEDAKRLMAVHGLDNLHDGGTARYRSTHFLCPDLGPIPVEIMAGYEILSGEAWQAVWPLSRERIQVGGANVFVPSDADLIDILQRLGRDKDQPRLQAMISPK